MNYSKANVEFKASHDWHNHTAHALLVCAFNKALSVGFFHSFQHHLHIKMKKRSYSWMDKLSTLWASIVVGCNHRVEINDKLGAHEQAAAALFSLSRFPDQSQINRLLWAFKPHNLDEWRRLHLSLLCKHTRAKRRSLWLRLPNRQRLLPIDIDQRGVVVRGKQFELATKGHFCDRRAKRGYQLSLAFCGGKVGEVIDEYFDPGKTAARDRVDDLLTSIEIFCQQSGIPPECILIRGDAQYGTAATIAKIEARGFHYLLKGVSPARATKLMKEVGEEVIFWRVENGEQRLPAWMCDMGKVCHEATGGERGRCEARTLLMVRQEEIVRKKRRRKGEEDAKEEKKRVRKVDYFLSDLDDEQLGVESVLEVYNDRPTIERYFYDEEYSLGARQVRTHSWAGAAMFQFLVATTNNLLRWMKHTT
ncbi:MAG TPA: transposase, partial [Blastocatellia bacterium]